MGDITTYDADWLLEQWVIWSRQGSGSASGFLGQLVGGASVQPAINDDEALIIERVVCAMIAVIPFQAEAVLAYYRSGRSYIAVSERMNMNRRRAAATVQAGVAWVDGKVDDIRGLDRCRNNYSALRRPMDKVVVSDLSRSELRSKLIAALEPDDL